MTDVRDLTLNLPLKQMDGSLLTHSIVTRVRALNLPGNSVMKVEEALHTASFLHRQATRSVRANMPRTHYIEHPLRNTERVLRYGVTDVSIIIANILHDTVEDCAEEIVRSLAGLGASVDQMTPSDIRRTAFGWVTDNFGWNVSFLVGQVTNNFYPKNATKAEKRGLYVEKVREIVTNPEVFLVKFPDWVDNAVGLRHNVQAGNESMIAHLASKYEPMCDIFESAMDEHVEALVSPEGFLQMQHHLADGRMYLAELRELSK
jgi:hypothetical protein